MAFTATPVDGSSTPIPMSSAVPDGTNTPLPIEGGPSISTGGNTLVPVSIYEKDGNNVVLGATSDAAVVGDVAGSISAKQRGLSKILNDIWDSVNHRFHVNVDNVNTNGQALMVNSAPVVIASDQTVLKAKQDFLEVAGQAAGSVTSTSTPIILSTDVSAYKSWSFQMSGTWTMTLAVQFSNDNTNWSSGFLSLSTSGSIVNTIAANGMYSGPVIGRYMRIIPTAWTSNASGVGTLELYSHPFTFTSTFAVEQGTWSVQPGNTANTTPWLIAHANNNASVPTGAANTVIKGTPGALATIVVTTAGTGAGNVLIYDNATTNSGTVLFAFPATVSVAQFYQIYGWAKVGMTAQNVLNGPVFTVFYA